MARLGQAGPHTETRKSYILNTAHTTATALRSHPNTSTASAARRYTGRDSMGWAGAGCNGTGGGQGTQGAGHDAQGYTTTQLSTQAPASMRGQPGVINTPTASCTHCDMLSAPRHGQAGCPRTRQAPYASTPQPRAGLRRLRLASRGQQQAGCQAWLGNRPARQRRRGYTDTHCHTPHEHTLPRTPRGHNAAHPSRRSERRRSSAILTHSTRSHTRATHTQHATAATEATHWPRRGESRALLGRPRLAGERWRFGRGHSTE